MPLRLSQLFCCFTGGESKKKPKSQHASSKKQQESEKGEIEELASPTQTAQLSRNDEGNEINIIPSVTASQQSAKDQPPAARAPSRKLSKQNPKRRNKSPQVYQGQQKKQRQEKKEKAEDTEENEEAEPSARSQSLEITEIGRARNSRLPAVFPPEGPPPQDLPPSPPESAPRRISLQAIQASLPPPRNFSHPPPISTPHTPPPSKRVPPESRIPRWSPIIPSPPAPGAPPSPRPRSHRLSIPVAERLSATGLVPGQERARLLASARAAGRYLDEDGLEQVGNGWIRGTVGRGGGEEEGAMRDESNSG
ncbi:hypothetical protein EDC01DRAFT_755537 [Geopyxis carbonaria]|nr:hypothetical protein EDC01DRAFT_755537 [Geopyxis carbonaria]